MAKKKLSKEDYPIVKYRVVNGNGYTVCNTWSEVVERIGYLTTNPLFKDEKRFQPQYVIKVTEEYIEL